VNENSWPPEVKTVAFLSAVDNTRQPTLFYDPGLAKPAPLLVALHTWSCDYLNPPEPAYADWCIAKGWVFLHPDFRGPNNKPDACGSELAVQDVLSAVDFARQTAHVDPDRIYLVGASGGGHMTLLGAGRAPHLWAAASVWCGIYDLRDWHAESLVRVAHYSEMISQSCGGAPGDSPEISEQYRRRSPSAWLEAAKGLPFDLNTGIQDGHTGSVPDSQTLNAFNALSDPAERIDPGHIAYITQNAAIPESLQCDIVDPVYSRRPVLFRRVSGNTRVTVFDGGHDMIPEAALAWLASQRKGAPAVWEINRDTGVDLTDVPTHASN
jgi:hypothetical protein